MFRQPVGTTFSDVWYKVGPTRPKVSPHAQFARRQRGHVVTYVIEEPATSLYYVVSEAAYFFVALLDGTRTVDGAWDVCNAQLGDNAPTQRECIDLLAKLQQNGLLVGELPLAQDMVGERIKQSRKRRRDQRTGQWMAWHIPVWNPEGWLEKGKGVWRAVFSPVGLAAWCVLVGVAVWLVWMNRARFGDELNQVALLDGRTLGAMAVIFLVLRAVHEVGHGAACKAFGGRVTEIGLMMIAWVLPLPYCDASSAWKMSSVWRRVVVSMGGIIFESVVAAVAAIVWAVVEPRVMPGVSSLAYQVMIVSGVTTLFFNLNPLLRYDGYYVLSDVADVPNLAQRSRELWKYVLNRVLFGVKTMKPVRWDRGVEGMLLWVYHPVALPYRLVVLGVIVLIVSQKFLGLGMVVAAVAVVVWVVWPMLKTAGYVVSSPTLVGHRARAVAVSVGLIGVVVAGVGVLPVGNSVYAHGVVEPVWSEPIRAAEDGFLERVDWPSGGRVDEGAVVFEMSNPIAVTNLAMAKAKVRAAQTEVDVAARKSGGEMAVAQVELAQRRFEAGRSEERVDGLVVRAPASGRLVSGQGTVADLMNRRGSFVRRGDLLGVVTADAYVVRVALPDRDAAYVFAPGREAEASVRVRGRAGRVYEAEVVRRSGAGTKELLAPGLGTLAGGSITLDPGDREGRRTLEAHEVVELRFVGEDVADDLWGGGRAKVRFELDDEPLWGQWMRRVRQYFKDTIG